MGSSDEPRGTGIVRSTSGQLAPAAASCPVGVPSGGGAAASEVPARPPGLRVGSRRQCASRRPRGGGRVGLPSLLYSFGVYEFKLCMHLGTSRLFSYAPRESRCTSIHTYTQLYRVTHTQTHVSECEWRVRGDFHTGERGAIQMRLHPSKICAIHMCSANTRARPRGACRSYFTSFPATVGCSRLRRAAS